MNKITNSVDALLSIWPALVAAIVVTLLSEKHSFKLAAARIACALLLALTATDPIVESLGRSPEVWRDVVLVLLGVMGFQIMKFLSSFDRHIALDFIRAWRGK